MKVDLIGNNSVSQFGDVTKVRDSSSLLSDDFFRSGDTMACLNARGKHPSLRDKLMICVIGLIKVSRQSIARKVGQGSREHDLHGDDFITF